MNTKLYYIEGYKYQVHANVSVQTDILGYDIIGEFYSLSPSGILTALKGYAWDGPSGPCPDWQCFMQPSLWHDILFQMMREAQLPESCFHQANKLFRDESMKRAKWWQTIPVKLAFKAVEDFGMKYAHVQPENVLVAT